MSEITLIDYGLGNIQAFAHIYKRLNISVQTASTTEKLKSARRLILPGVGAFDWAMTRLNDSGLRPTLDELVLERNVPVLGVCVGMQMMASCSEEGVLPGLGWIDGKVLRFNRERLKLSALPHMGWNDVYPTDTTTLFQDLEKARFYFLHSFHFLPDKEEVTLATADYGEPFTAAVTKRHIYGTQFHPEKSHRWGITLLKNFAQM